MDDLSPSPSLLSYFISSKISGLGDAEALDWQYTVELTALVIFYFNIRSDDNMKDVTCSD